MKRVLFLLSILTVFGFTGTYTSNTSVIIAPNSKLVINGKTNVNSFKCEYDILKLSDRIPVSFKRVENKIVFKETTLVLETGCFDCGGMGINSDFQKLLKAEEFPEVFIRLKEISLNPNHKNEVEAFLKLDISGVSRPYSIPVKLSGDDLLQVEGVLSLNIRDFNLEPPKKALGLIVVKDTIDINFQLKIKEKS